MKRFALDRCRKISKPRRISAERVRISRIHRGIEDLAVAEQARIVERLDGQVAIDAVVELQAEAGPLTDSLLDARNRLVRPDRQQVQAAEGGCQQ